MAIASKDRKIGLGRGLGALLSDSGSGNSTQNEQTVTRRFDAISSMNEISVNDIETNPFQPRTHFDQEALRELSDSIKLQGIIQPITVRQLDNKKFQLISGERRLQASKMAGLTTIPAYVRTANDQQMLEMALIENIQRENLNAIEIALSYQRLMTECQLKQEQLGDRVGKNRTTVNNYMRLLKLPPEIQASVRDNKISMGHARALVNIDNTAVQMNIFQRILDEELSVRKVEEAVRALNSGDGEQDKSKRKVSTKREITSLQSKLASHFGAKVTIKADEQSKGEIRIPFTSKEDLERILGAISTNESN
ncbi:MAG: ParB/RepB/Spo0J family partition protein [Spirosomaceae bacterium]|nr:ParB/RepB/Spo0J family partition protein [Spirosomataceae bacterium]